MKPFFPPSQRYACCKAIVKGMQVPVTLIVHGPAPLTMALQQAHGRLIGKQWVGMNYSKFGPSCQRICILVDVTTITSVSSKFWMVLQSLSYSEHAFCLT